MWILFFVLAFVPLQGQDDPIVVRLATESRLVPVYVSKTQADDTNFDAGYLTQLEVILRNDISLAGTLRLIDSSPEYEQLARQTLRDPVQSSPLWKRSGISYAIVPKITQKSLSAMLLNLAAGTVKQVTGRPLVGKLAEDRGQLHQLADALHEAMTGVPGIASSRLLYTQRQQGTGKERSSEVWECDYDGANARRLTPSGEYCVTPCYVPSKVGMHPKHYLYVSYGSGQARIYMAPLHGGPGKRVTTAKGNQLMPAMSRQRDQLAFICDLTGSPDLVLQPLNGETGQPGTLQLLYHERNATQSTPTLNPNGKEIAFTSDRDGTPRVYALTLPTSESTGKAKPRLISRQALNGSAPAWSPDGQKIAFCALTQGARQIWVYDRPSGQETQITSGPGHKENPSWARDSLHLVYNSANPNDTELYLVDINRKKPTKIALGHGDKHFPSFEP